MAKKRLYVPLSDDALASLKAFANARKCSLAALAGEMLEEMAPVALEMTSALLLVQKAPAAAMRQANEMLERKLAEADQMVMDLTPKATGKKKKTG